MSTLMKSKSLFFLIPIIFIGVYILIVLLYALFDVTMAPIESEAGWEFIFGTINYPIYAVVGVPRNLPQYGTGAYLLWFALLGSIQWGLVGVFVVLLFHVRKKMRISK